MRTGIAHEDTTAAPQGSAGEVWQPDLIAPPNFAFDPISAVAPQPDLIAATSSARYAAPGQA